MTLLVTCDWLPSLCQKPTSRSLVGVEVWKDWWCLRTEHHQSFQIFLWVGIRLRLWSLINLEYYSMVSCFFPDCLTSHAINAVTLNFAGALISCIWMWLVFLMFSSLGWLNDSRENRS